MKIHFRGKIYAEDFVSGVVPVVAVIIQSLNISGKFIREHGVNFVFVAVLHGLFVIPAFEFQHGERLFHALDFLFTFQLLLLNQFQTLGIGFTALGTPLHKLLDVFDFHAGFFQTFHQPQGFQLLGIKMEDAAAALDFGE